MGNSPRDRESQLLLLGMEVQNALSQKWRGQRLLGKEVMAPSLGLRGYTSPGGEEESSLPGDKEGGTLI